MQTEARSQPHASAHAKSPGADTGRRTGELSWAAVGSIAGALGALVIAVFFLVLDVFARQALWTPAALGVALFLGEHMPEDSAPQLVFVLGYTAVHGAVFLSVGLMAAFALEGRRGLRPLRGIGLAAVFFAVFEVLILGFLRLASPGLVGSFGILEVTAANLLASGAMAAFLSRMAPRVGP